MGSQWPGISQTVSPSSGAAAPDVVGVQQAVFVAAVGEPQAGGQRHLRQAAVDGVALVAGIAHRVGVRSGSSPGI